MIHLLFRRSFQVLFLVFFCVQLYGATTVVSNEAQLVAAVNTNNGKPAGGDVIIMNAGTYTFNTTVHASADPNIGIDIARPLVLKSAAGAAVTLNFANNYGIRIAAPNTTLDTFSINGQYFGVQAVDANRAYADTLSGLVIRGLTVNITQDGQAISTGGVVDSIIENCTVTATMNSGIVLDRSTPGIQSNRNLVINNSVTSTTKGSGVAVNLSDYNTIAGNSLTNVAFNGVFVNGGQHNYVSQNFMDNGLTFGSEIPSANVRGRQSLRNYAGNNTITLKSQPGSDPLWFNFESNYNMAFLNDGSLGGEAGMALFNSVGNYVRGNNFHNNAFGGIVVRKDPASGPTVPNHNSIQQNYFHDQNNNGGIVTSTETLNDYGFNYISGNPAQISQSLVGILTSATTNSNFYSNTIRDLRIGEQLQDSTSGASFYLNRHINSPFHIVYTGNSATFDSGSPTLGGSYYSDFSSANGNPSSGTPYTNYSDQNGAVGVAQDRYPFASENLGKSYAIALRIPSAGSYLATSTYKTVAWSSQGCVAVDLYLLNSANSTLTTIVSNTPDYGFYRWLVPNVGSGTYQVRADCKLANGGVSGKVSVGPAFQITTPDLILLSPQTNLITDVGTPMQISWRKSAAIAAVDIYVRYADSEAFTLLQAGVTADFFTLPAPSVSSNRVSVRLGYGGSGDSTDGWFTIRAANTGQFTAPSTNNLYIGTPTLVEWVSPQGTDSVSLDLITGGGTKNLVTQLGDFSSYLMLVPDLAGGGATLRLTFYNSAGTAIQTLTGPAQNIQNSSFQPDTIAVSTGSGQSAALNTAFATPLQAVVKNSVGTPVAGVPVVFTAPASGASGTFGGSATVVTNGSGIAVAPAFTANGVTGTYNMVAATGSLSTSFTLTNTAAALSAQTNIGYFFNSNFVLDANGSGSYEGPPQDKFFFYVTQQPGDIAVFGDWNGDGRTKVGIYRNGFWILDYNGNGVYDYPVDKFYGLGGATTDGFIPIVGDWNHDGRSKIGFYKSGFWCLDYNGNGTYDGSVIDRFFGFGGNANEFPLLGDWNHDGRTKVGVFYNGNFMLDYDGDNAYTFADKIYPYLPFSAGDKPVIGDWSGNGFSKIGIYRNGFWILDYNGNGVYDYPLDKFYGFGGNTGEIPLVGDWNGDGRSKVGIYLRGFWILDFNGNGSFDGTGVGQDRFIGFGGNSGEQPVIGKW